MDIEINRTIATVTTGDHLDSVSIPITLQRLVMEAGANRDFSLIHHDKEVAQATGATDAYMNTFFIAGMFERLLRNWMGPTGRLRKMQNLRMKMFNCVGDMVTFNGTVTAVNEAERQVTIDLSAGSENGETVTATAIVVLPN